MANAFGSTKHTYMKAQLDPYLKEEDRCFFDQRRSQAVIEVDCPDGRSLVQVGCGGLMGDGEACENFLMTYGSAIIGWNAALTLRDPRYRTMIAFCPVG